MKRETIPFVTDRMLASGLLIGMAIGVAVIRT
jgi:hypothetical protein